MVAPKLNRRRALFVSDKIDEILAWEKAKEREKDVRFVDLGALSLRLRAGQYWRMENLKSFDEFLEKRFPESRRKAYYLMAIHESLTQSETTVTRSGLEQGGGDGQGGAKGRESFDCATWLHQAKELPKEEFKREVERHLTGKDTEPWELIYFKLYKSQLPVIEQALETAALMLGSDKSRGYMLEMICADFLAGANLKTKSEALVISLERLFELLPEAKRPKS